MLRMMPLILVMGGALLCSCGKSEDKSSPPSQPTTTAVSVVPEPAHQDTPSKFPALASLPTAPVPSDNPLTPAKITLGRFLFFDTRLSGDNQFSCATCHDPAKGWGDGRDVSMGYPGTRHWRNSQTVINSAYYAKLFWAGEVTSLETQANAAITGNLAGNGDPTMIEERLAQIPEYVEMFRDAFGVDRPIYALALKAIASFERSEVTSRNAPFDRYMNGEKNALSAKELAGLDLFKGKAGCIQCHNGPLLTDEDYHNIGVPKNPLFEKDNHAQISLRYQHYIRGVDEQTYRHADTDLGLYYVTKRKEDKGKFRTPQLRDLVYTAPYMHNGMFPILEEVIDFYNKGGGDDPNKSQFLKKLNLTNVEKDALIAFLESLTGDEITVEPPQLPEYKPMK